MLIHMEAINKGNELLKIAVSAEDMSVIKCMADLAVSKTQAYRKAMEQFIKGEITLERLKEYRVDVLHIKNMLEAKIDGAVSRADELMAKAKQEYLRIINSCHLN